MKPLLLLLILIISTLLICGCTSTPKPGDLIPCNTVVTVQEKIIALQPDGNFNYFIKTTDGNFHLITWGENIDIFGFFSESNNIKEKSVYDLTQPGMTGQLIYTFNPGFIAGISPLNVTTTNITGCINCCVVLP